MSFEVSDSMANLPETFQLRGRNWPNLEPQPIQSGKNASTGAPHAAINRFLPPSDVVRAFLKAISPCVFGDLSDAGESWGSGHGRGSFLILGLDHDDSKRPNF